MIQKPIKIFKTFLGSIFKKIEKWTIQYPYTTQNLQVTLIYTLAVMDILYNVLTSTITLGYTNRTFLGPLMMKTKGIAKLTFLQFWAAPERSFVLSFLFVDLLVIRSYFNLSKLVKFNLLLAFQVLFLQGVALTYWDLFCNRDIVLDAVNRFNNEDKLLTVITLYSLFFIFCSLYIYFYVKAIRNEFPEVKGLEWLTDSAANYARILTPSMKKRFDEYDKDEEDDLEEDLNDDDLEEDLNDDDDQEEN
jgi:hypothetical protein